jgi:hypothetical protein
VKCLILSIIACACTLAPDSFAQQQRPTQTTNGPCSPIFNGNGNVQNCTIVTDRGTLKAVQSGDTVTISAVGGRVEPVSFGLIFDAEVSFVSYDLPSCMICGDDNLVGADGKPDKKTILVFWQTPALLPGEPVTIKFSSEKPARLVKFVSVKFPH